MGSGTNDLTTGCGVFAEHSFQPLSDASLLIVLADKFGYSSVSIHGDPMAGVVFSFEEKAKVG